MSLKPIQISIDTVTKKTVLVHDNIRYGDTLEISLTMYEKNVALDITGQDVKIIIRKPDGYSVLQTLTGAITNKIVAELDQQATLAVGKAQGIIRLEDANGVSTSNLFTFEIGENLETDIVIASTDSVETLKDIQNIIDAFNLTNDLEDTIATGTTLKSGLESDITTGDILKDNLESDIITATNTKDALNTSDTNALATKSLVDASKASADASKIAVDSSIANANAFATTYADIANAQINITNLTYKSEATAEMIKDSIPSGFTKLSDLDYTTMATTPNTIKLLTESVAYVNGYKVTIAAGTVITMDAPPTTGTREDLVFLECYKKTDVSGAITWNYRLRVVDGVDFSKNIEGIPYNYVDGFNNRNDISLEAMPQGGLTAPLLQSPTSSLPYYLYFSKANDGTRTSNNFNDFAKSDTGLYIAGRGDDISKGNLATTDGYVYAIPMFKVHRRNSGGYSVSNGNGAKVRSSNSLTVLASISGQITNATVANSAIYTVGDYLYSGTICQGKVTAIVDSTHISIQCITAFSVGTVTWLNYGAIIPLLFADIIVDRDVVDLRHMVSLTGFNFQAILEENFDKLIRGEL